MKRMGYGFQISNRRNRGKNPRQPSTSIPAAPRNMVTREPDDPRQRQCSDGRTLPKSRPVTFGRPHAERKRQLGRPPHKATGPTPSANKGRSAPPPGCRRCRARFTAGSRRRNLGPGSQCSRHGEWTGGSMSCRCAPCDRLVAPEKFLYVGERARARHRWQAGERSCHRAATTAAGRTASARRDRPRRRISRPAPCLSAITAAGNWYSMNGLRPSSSIARPRAWVTPDRPASRTAICR